MKTENNTEGSLDIDDHTALLALANFTYFSSSSNLAAFAKRLALFYASAYSHNY